VPCSQFMNQDDGAAPKKTEEISDLINAVDDGPEALPCNCSYVLVCILLPLLNGALNGFIWPGYTLHFVENGWSLVTCSVAVTLGCLLRAVTQQLQLRGGYWLIVPMAVIHLIFAVLALMYQASLWAIFAQIVVCMCLDPTSAIEGIAFDTFGASQVQARQATSTILSVCTVALAGSCTIGGVLYDLGRWTAVCTYHCICQGVLLLLVCTQPSVRKSFMEACFKRSAAGGAVSAIADEGCDAKEMSLAVVPEVCEVPLGPGRMELPGAVAWEEVEEVSGTDAESHRRSEQRGSTREESNAALPVGAQSDAVRTGRASRGTRGSRESHESLPTRSSVKSSRTNMSGRSILSAFSRVTSLSQAGQDFSHHFLTSSAITPQIVGATGSQTKPRVEVEDFDDDAGKTEAKTGIPRGIRFPAFLIVLCSFCNNFSYGVEFSTFAIFFKEGHNWNEATLAGVAQTAGDLTAAIMMQVIPFFVSHDYDPIELDCFRRFLHHLTSQPYNLSFILFTWVLFNGGMIVPVLPVAITAQVLMGTTFVYTSKWITDMNLFYSMGDSKLFMTLQILCSNAHALGGSLGGLLGGLLYTLNPVAPFICSCAVACVVFVIYTAGFCARLGFGDDIDTAEEKRSRRVGHVRVSRWANGPRKTTLHKGDHCE